MNWAFMVIISGLLMTYVISIESRQEVLEGYRIEQEGDFYSIEYFDDDPDNYPGWYLYEDYNTRAEAVAVLKEIKKSIRRGVWYDFFGIGRFSSGVIFIIAFIIPVILYLVIKYVFDLDWYKIY